MRKADEYPDDCLDRNNLYESGNAIYISASGTYSYSMIKESGEFVVNLTTEELAKRRITVACVPAEMWINGRDALDEGKGKRTSVRADYRGVSGKYRM